ncbi:MAG: hypothetical protein KC589_02615 [Nanoarchaeota archaeon]|nr:hypothetical protein [Nanoarchaeota archaeon]
MARVDEIKLTLRGFLDPLRNIDELMKKSIEDKKIYERDLLDNKELVEKKYSYLRSIYEESVDVPDVKQIENRFALVFQKIEEDMNSLYEMFSFYSESNNDERYLEGIVPFKSSSEYFQSVFSFAFR